MIIGIEGNLGNGKTATMAAMALHYSSICSVCSGMIPSRKKYIIPPLHGDCVIFDCRCEAPKPHKIHSNFWIEDIPLHYVTCVEDINKIYAGYAFLDEFWSWIDSRVSGYSDTNMVVTGILLNSRKRGFHVVYESKLIHMIDRRIRELTDYVLRPTKYVNFSGELVIIDQNMLYPVNMLPYLGDSWVLVDELSGASLTDLQDCLFQFKLDSVACMYDTREEIRSLKEGEPTAGIEKGIKMENNFSKEISRLIPDCKISQSIQSRGWDVQIDTGTKKMSFDTTSVRIARKTDKIPYIDLRKKDITGMLKIAHKAKSEPYFSYTWEGKWYVMSMLESHAVRSTVSCRDAVELCEALK